MAVVEELKLKSSIVIDGKPLPIEILTLLDGDVIAYKIDGRIYSTKPLKKDDDDPPPKVEYEKELNRQKMAIRSPNNTTLFLSWLDKIKCRDFDIKEFMKRYSWVTQDALQKIIAYQIARGRLLQLSNTRFRVTKSTG